MARSIDGRIQALENSCGRGPCSECKLAPGGPGYIVLAGERNPVPLDRGGRPVDPDERCAGCERFLWFVIRVVEDAAVGGDGDGFRYP